MNTYQAAKARLLDVHNLPSMAAFWSLVRAGHTPGDCNRCQWVMDRHPAIDKVVAEGSWWVRHRADEHFDTADDPTGGAL